MCTWFHIISLYATYLSINIFSFVPVCCAYCRDIYDFIWWMHQRLTASVLVSFYIIIWARLFLSKPEVQWFSQTGSLATNVIWLSSMASLLPARKLQMCVTTLVCVSPVGLNTDLHALQNKYFNDRAIFSAQSSPVLELVKSLDCQCASFF